VIDSRKDLTGNKQRRNTDYAMLKCLADIWEAYFNGILTEREQMGDRVHDLEAFFHHLIIRKYEVLLPFAQCADIPKHLKGRPQLPRLEEDDPGYTIRKVTRMDPEIESGLGPAPKDGGEAVRMGSLVTSTRPTKGKPLSIFNVVSKKAVQQLQYYESRGLKRTPYPSPSRVNR